ncbi:Septal ring factor EnvC, activator of murein hydrolases AmiA and AmiB [Hydrocarboniphaga daqingensis]|uniref:Septal ring factor EnvC, activator of murein hydrolases AmiA and AmiB n=1 Tax=Hydrocarboniphaga daqingensis TaxID=490188 RepID=A0A1M5LC10_9GAMM|nr:peptidoglycan DD-metalloendopeptidase family protein [Hydrocarboniphaga daqingensis]SHG62510.1 Septal ring factor EnvC, activator of murein hydrolases AmiA and AmiB [Hydrocarboniphaga daqingensis]
MASNTPDRKRAHPAPRCRPLAAAAGLWLALSLVASPSPAADPVTGDIKKSEQELARVKGKIDALRSKLERERGQKDELSEALQAAEQRLNQAQAELRRLHREVAEQNERIRANQAQQVEAEYRLGQQREALARQIRAAYMMGNRARTQLWLSQDDTARIGRVLTEYDYVNRARADQVAQVQAEIDRIAQLQVELEQQRSQLEALELKQAETLRQLEQARSQRKSTLQAIDQRIASAQTELKQAQADEAQVRKLLETLKKALADIPSDFGGTGPFAQLRGKLPWPLRGPILADYGSPKADGRLSWSGRWIAASSGTPVRAIARGRVAYVGWLQRYGLIVILEHSGGYFTLYGHCASSVPSVGQWVDPGQVIATAGDTGGHERSGVYLEIRKGSTALDPRQWLGK